MFEKDLAASATRGNYFWFLPDVRSHAHEVRQAASTAANQFADQATLGAKGHAVSCVFYVAAGDDAAIVNQGGRPHAILRIGGVGPKLYFFGLF